MSMYPMYPFQDEGEPSSFHFLGCTPITEDMRVCRWAVYCGVEYARLIRSYGQRFDSASEMTITICIDTF
jgi:hypothetical protein